jgi:holo-[acyl-carrier protein] synthase
MIIGLGVDIVELKRIARSFERFGMKFAEKILAPAELDQLPVEPTAFLASRFAVKEAAVKALGTGFRDGISPTQIEVRSGSLGKPELIFHGAALARFNELGAAFTHVSLSHGRESSVAVVILEK